MRGPIVRLCYDYGFIRRSDQLFDDAFFHATALCVGEFHTLLVGDVVEFDLIDHPKGPRAVNVRLVAPCSAQVQRSPPQPTFNNDGGGTDEEQKRLRK